MRSNLSFSAALGVGQTWQDMAGSRATGTTYTNTSGKPIGVMIRGANGGTIIATVGGVQLASVSTNSANVWPTITFIVPNNATYVVTVSGMSDWTELR